MVVGCRRGRRRYFALAAVSRRQTILPFTTVAIGAPWNSRLSNGVFWDLLAESLEWNVHF